MPEPEWAWATMHYKLQGDQEILEDGSPNFFVAGN